MGKSCKKFTTEDQVIHGFHRLSSLSTRVCNDTRTLRGSIDYIRPTGPRRVVTGYSSRIRVVIGDVNV